MEQDSRSLCLIEAQSVVPAELSCRIRNWEMSMSAGGTGPQRKREGWGGTQVHNVTATYASSLNTQDITLSYKIKSSNSSLTSIKVQYILSAEAVNTEKPGDIEWSTEITDWGSSSPSGTPGTEGWTEYSVSGSKSGITWFDAQYVSFQFTTSDTSENVAYLWNQKPPFTLASG